MKHTLQKNVENEHEQQPKKAAVDNETEDFNQRCSRYSGEQSFELIFFQCSGLQKQPAKLQINRTPFTNYFHIPKLRGRENRKQGLFELRRL